MIQLHHDFVNGVLSGDIVYGKPVKLAIDRHMHDLERQRSKDFAFWFDEEAADRSIKILKKHVHTAGAMANQPFDVQPWQAFMYASIFGWKRMDTGYRRFTKSYSEVARKNGKSEVAAPIGNIGLLFDREFGSEIYTAATKRDQARIVFDRCHYMLGQLAKSSKAVASRVRRLKFNVNVPSENSKMQPLASDANSLDGLLPHMAIIDEYHAHKDNELVKVLETGMGGRQQPLLFIITTAGFNIDGPCYAFREVCMNILKGEVVNDSVFALIFTIDEEDDWNDEKCWIKANPNIGKTPTWEFMRNAHTAAKTEGAQAEIQFKTKNLNIWTSTSLTWIPDDIWQACLDDFTKESLEGRDCYGGLDIGSVSDLTALCLYFPPTITDPYGRFVHWYWMPRENMDEKSREQRVDYRQWERDGYINVTPGNCTDYDYVTNDIMNIRARFNIKQLAYDRALSLAIVPKLHEQGVPLMKFGQGSFSMHSPVIEVERLIRSKEVRHRGNKITRWMMGNVLLKIDSSGASKIDKQKSRKKVDGPVAMAMAVGAYQRDNIDKQQEQSYYNNNDLLVV